MPRHEYAAKRKQELAHETAAAICRVHDALGRFWGNHPEPAYWHIFLGNIPSPIRVAMLQTGPSPGHDAGTIRACDIDIGGLLQRLEGRLLRYRRVSVAPIYLKTLMAAIEADIGARPVITAASSTTLAVTNDNNRKKTARGPTGGRGYLSGPHAETLERYRARYRAPSHEPRAHAAPRHSRDERNPSDAHPGPKTERRDRHRHSRQSETREGSSRHRSRSQHGQRSIQQEINKVLGITTPTVAEDNTSVRDPQLQQLQQQTVPGNKQKYTSRSAEHCAEREPIAIWKSFPKTCCATWRLLV